MSSIAPWNNIKNNYISHRREREREHEEESKGKKESDCQIVAIYISLKHAELHHPRASY